jgi:hypothetical protein
LGSLEQLRGQALIDVAIRRLHHATINGELAVSPAHFELSQFWRHGNTSVHHDLDGVVMCAGLRERFEMADRDVKVRRGRAGISPSVLYLL